MTRTSQKRAIWPFGAGLQPVGLGLGHYVIFTLALLTTVFAYIVSEEQAMMRAEDHFDREVSHITSVILERMETYEDALHAGVVAIDVVDGQIDFLTWRAFERSLDLGRRYPGVNGIGVIFRVPSADLEEFVVNQRATRPAFRVHPEVDAQFHFPITFIEPESDNVAAVGLDIGFETSRLNAMQVAAVTGTTQMTAPIVLVQDERSSAGFLIYAPFYETDEGTGEQVFIGAVYAPFIMDRLIAGTLRSDYRSVKIEIRDGESLLYTDVEDGQILADPDPMFSRNVDIDLFGRTWTVALETTAGFRAMNGTAAPTLVLVFGLLVEAALLGLFLGLTRANRRAQDAEQLSQSLTEALQIEKRELEASNLALERYNYLSSHDLRTPLRGMHDVADNIREDVGSLFPNEEVDSTLEGHLTDLNALIGQMDTLIGGMVAYAQIGRAKENRTLFSTAEELSAVVQDQQRHGATIILSGGLPEIFCNRELFRIIVVHLVSNAVTHHPRPSEAMIKLECRAIGRNLILQVEDDGNGIPSHLQGQLFDRVLRPNGGQMVPRTQMGLAMVKRATSAIGGYVTLTSHVGEGSCFTVILLDVHGGTSDPVVKDRAEVAVLGRPPVRHDTPDVPERDAA